MSELTNAQTCKRDFQRQLLSTVSALALLAIYGTTEAWADQDADRPTVWIELGGQFEQIGTDQKAFAPPFSAVEPEINVFLPGNVQIPPGSFQKPLDHSFGLEGKILFEPQATDWIFSAGFRYGRSNGEKHTHQQTAPKTFLLQNGYRKYLPASYGKFADAVTRKTESHLIADFQAGKDVGLGFFGRGGSSVFSVGLRFAQFDTSMHANLSSGPNPFQYKYIGSIKFPLFAPHAFLGKVQTARSFLGFGPSFSWDASAPVAGSTNAAEFTFDWGLNAAVLFGRQKANVQHQTSEFYKAPVSKGHSYPSHNYPVYQTGTKHSRSRMIAVPNIGGMAGFSLKFPNAKVSLGYRADFFFGAMDGGIDAAKKENVGFYGPFATISVGLGG